MTGDVMDFHRPAGALPPGMMHPPFRGAIALRC
jgi:hypothetical protein